MNKFLVLLPMALFLCESPLFAQTVGEVGGKVMDENAGEPLIGANVLIVGTTLGSVTDFDGSFQIKNILPGSYSVRISFIGYTTKIVEHVLIEPDKPNRLDVVLQTEVIESEEVVVQAEAIRNTESALLQEQRKSPLIRDAISAEQIRRTPDATSGDALRRVTGISLVDNKFVFIRGITDRYNVTTLDGASVTSTEVGKRSFPFDLVPANLLDHTSIVKSATPNLPGDFSGGLVQMTTIDFPTNSIMKLTVSSSYNTVTTGVDFYSSQGGTRDWLGFDNGSRRFPGDQPDVLSVATKASNNWAPNKNKAPYNGSFSLAFGDRYDFDKDNPSTNQLGVIAALSYKNSFQRNEKIINDIALGRTNTGTKDEYAVLWGAIANFGYKFDGLHKISFKNNFNQSADDYVEQFRSEDLGTTLENLYTIVNWTQRSTYTGQLSGEHSFPSAGELSIQWRAAVSSSRRDDPDRKVVTYYRPLDDSRQPFTAAVNQRSWAFLNERSKSFATDFTLPVGVVKMKFGSLIENRATNYRIRYFNVVPDYIGGISDSMTQLPLDVIYSQDNFGRGKYIIQESSNASDSYTGKQDLFAWYFMADLPFEVSGNNFRLTGGARVENSEQNLHVPRTLSPEGPVIGVRLKSVDVLPSANFTYILNDITNIRLAYSQSVNRPEFRELAPTSSFDQIKYELVGGNPDLQRSLIRNYDTRVELFPDIGELLAVGFFHKHISNAIEEQLVQTATRTRTWFNSEKATNTGWEFEFRKSLKFFGGFFNDVMIAGNYTRVESRVRVVKDDGNSSNPEPVVSTRPLQGQSPYIINLSLQFTEPIFGAGITVLYNKFGRRLDAVGFLASDIYEEPREVVDLAITESIIGELEAKLTIKNLLDKERVLTRDRRLYERTSTGRTYGIQLSYSM